jgi:hypothetical protein
MTVASFGLMDLSLVTDHLKTMLTNYYASPLWNPPIPFTPNVTGNPPDMLRSLGGCQVSLYLFHVSEDKYQRNLDLGGKQDPSVGPLHYTPLGLDLYYLLSAYAGDYAQEQQSLTMAMRCFHENSIVQFFVPPSGPQMVAQEFTLTMETESLDQLSRMWQAFTSSFRFGAIYKASVIFISPDAALPPAPPAIDIEISTDPSFLPFLLSTSRTFRFRKSDGTFSPSIEISPARVGPGQAFLLEGGGFKAAGSTDHVWLQGSGLLTPVDITSWLSGPLSAQTSTRYTLLLPNSSRPPPANTPPPGPYELSVGDATGPKSLPTPFTVAPGVQVTLNPPRFPLALSYVVNGLGFTTGLTEVFMGSHALTLGAPGAGNFQVNGTGTQITFQPPALLNPGFYFLRIRVNQVEADPSWWVQV